MPTHSLRPSRLVRLSNIIISSPTKATHTHIFNRNTIAASVMLLPSTTTSIQYYNTLAGSSTVGQKTSEHVTVPTPEELTDLNEILEKLKQDQDPSRNPNTYINNITTHTHSTTQTRC